MGTRGLKIIRHKGKYYIYYNHWDSNPGIFGTEVISLIPTDAEGYEAWLQSTRALYDELSDALDDLLTIRPSDLLDSSPTIDPSKERYRHWRGLDDQLHQLPSCIPMDYDERLPCDYEWIYHIDLDRERFTVNYGAHFKLSNIPRNKVWKRALENDGFGDCILDLEKIPEGCVVDPRFREVREVGELESVYKKLRFEPGDTFYSGVTPLAEIAHHRVLVMLAFESFSWCHYVMLKRFLKEWSPHDFLFRELAYAILSIAAGDFGFQAYVHVKGGIDSGYVVLPKEEACVGSPEFLSAFARGFHLPEQIPGSAPMEEVYWFNGILICLAGDLETQENREDAMAKMVLLAQGARVKEFYGIVMSLEHAIFVKGIQDDKGDTAVKHSPPVCLFRIQNHLAVHPRERPPRDGRQSDGQADRRVTLGSVKELCAAFPGFSMLTEFMNDSVEIRLQPTTAASEGRFPVEIYHLILSHVNDNQTYISCAKVSRTFRAYCQSRVRLGKSMTITNLHSSEPIAFKVLDHDTGETMVAESIIPWFDDDYSQWHIVIGPPNRPTLLDQVSFNLTIKLPNTIDPRLARMENEAFDPTEEDSQALRLPRYAPFIYHSRVWVRWLTRILSPLPTDRWGADEAHYPTSTAPDIRELWFAYGRYRFRMFLHPATPDEGFPSTRKWETALWRINQKLEMHLGRDGYVLVTFGNIVRMFWWTVRPGFKRMNYDSLTGGVLTNVLPALDVREQRHRELIEEWIRVFWKGSWDRGEDGNPLSRLEKMIDKT